MRYLLFALLIAGCHPKAGDVYRSGDLSGRIRVTDVAACDHVIAVSNATMSQVAGLAGHVWEPVVYSIDPSEDCVGFWIEDEPGRVRHSVMDRETFVRRFRRD